MNLRFDSNNLRLRLRKSDIDLLQQTGEVCDAVVFCEGNELQYAIKVEQVPFINAEYKPGKITVYVPLPLIQKWIATNQVSLQHDQPLYNGFHLNIIIEKELPCRHTAIQNWTNGINDKKL